MRNLKKRITDQLSSEIQIPPEIAEKNKTWLSNVEPLRSIIFEDLRNLLICSTVGGVGLAAGLGVVKVNSLAPTFQFFGWLVFLFSFFLMSFSIVTDFARLSNSLKKHSVATAFFAAFSMALYANMCYVIYGTLVIMQVKK